jgi:hypothetical protein
MIHAVLTFLLSAASAANAAAPVGALPFGEPGWQLEGDAAVESVDGRPTLRIGTGWAYRRDVRLEDGTVELDVQVTRRRSFVYLTFRMADDREYEELYLRPHKSDLPDAVQYAPVYQGQSAWQLYHGPGATAAVPFEPGAWTHVRLVVQGRRAAVYIGAADTPALVVPRLGHEAGPGYIALRAFLPPGMTAAGPIARFANVVVRPGVVPVDLGLLPATPSAPEPGAIRAWAVSSAIPALAEMGVPGRPEDTVVGAYRRVEALPGGLVELHRAVRLPEGTRDVTTAARVRVHAERAGLRRLDLGFSDRATVFLNGEPLFRGEASYSYAGRREGLIGYEQAALYLPLRSGENELLVVLSDSFGGLGLMGRFADLSGLTVEPR